MSSAISAIDTLLAIEEIKKLKARYLRGIDTADIELLKNVFASQASCAFYGGSYTHVYDTRDEILQFLKQSFHPQCISKHNCHHPEIEILDTNNANGRWGLNDYFEDFKSNTLVVGAAFYEDVYINEQGQWRIKHTGYKRLYEQVIPRNPEAIITAHYLSSLGKQ